MATTKTPAEIRREKVKARVAEKRKAAAASSAKTVEKKKPLSPAERRKARAKTSEKPSTAKKATSASKPKPTRKKPVTAKKPPAKKRSRSLKMLNDDGTQVRVDRLGGGGTHAVVYCGKCGVPVAIAKDKAGKTYRCELVVPEMRGKEAVVQAAPWHPHSKYCGKRTDVTKPINKTDFKKYVSPFEDDEAKPKKSSAKKPTPKKTSTRKPAAKKASTTKKPVKKAPAKKTATPKAAGKAAQK